MIAMKTTAVLMTTIIMPIIVMILMSIIMMIVPGVAVPRSLLSPNRSTISDARKAITRETEASISETESRSAVCRSAKSAVPKLTRETVAEASAKARSLIVKTTLQVRFLPRIVEPLPLGIEARPAVAPRLHFVIRFL